ncbi:MAG: bifunctional nuclease family protein [Verrucomicrobia bacterium]|nr:bifunctional nuclease family protein [Verrucomicrobiota bacterium]
MNEIETSELIQLKFSKIMQTRTYTMVILGTEEKRFPIYTDPNVGRLLQLSLTGVEKPRPLTHDLVTELLLGLKVKIKQVVINDLQQTTYFARLFLEEGLPNGQRHIVEVDARPSDCITLALLYGAPVYSTRAVFDASIPLQD